MIDTDGIAVVGVLDCADDIRVVPQVVVRAVGLDEPNIRPRILRRGHVRGQILGKRVVRQLGRDIVIGDGNILASVGIFRPNRKTLRVNRILVIECSDARCGFRGGQSLLRQDGGVEQVNGIIEIAQQFLRRGDRGLGRVGRGS